MVDAIATSPPTSSSRSRMFSSPLLDPVPPVTTGSKPAPSSRTVTCHSSSRTSTATDVPAAPECFAAFCTASMAKKYSAASTASGGRSSLLTEMVTGMALVAVAARNAGTSPSSSSSRG
jgi:hypothetical protein